MLRVYGAVYIPNISLHLMVAIITTALSSSIYLMCKRGGGLDVDNWMDLRSTRLVGYLKYPNYECQQVLYHLFCGVLTSYKQGNMPPVNQDPPLARHTLVFVQSLG